MRGKFIIIDSVFPLAKVLMMSEKPVVFISYSRHDFDFAKALHEFLEAQGDYDPWLDVADIPASADWQESIDDGIRRARYFILLVSPWSINSGQVRYEWEHALTRQKDGQALDIVQFVIHAIPEESRTQLLAETPDWATIPWIDQRAADPLQIEQTVLQWLEGQRDQERLDAVPVLPPPRRMYRSKIPAAARFTALAQISIGLMTFALSLALLVLFLGGLLSPRPVTINMDSALLITAPMLILIGVYLGIEITWSGWRVFGRRVDQTPYAFIGRLAVPSVGVFALGLGILRIIRYFPDATVFNLTLFNGIIAAMAADTLLTALMVVVILRHFKALRRWAVTYSRIGWGTLQAASARDSNKDRVIVREAVQHVVVLSAPQDAPFAVYVSDFLQNSGLRIHPPGDPQAEGYVLVMSGWAVDDPVVTQAWRQALACDLPLFPLRLEDFSQGVPPELAIRNWVDVRSNIANGLNFLLRALRGESFTEEERERMAAPEKGSTGVIIQPKETRRFLYGGMIAGVLLAAIGGVVFPLIMHNYPKVAPTHWLAAALLVVVGALFVYTTLSAVMRCMTWRAALGVWAALSVVGIGLCAYLWEVIEWELLPIDTQPAFPIVLAVYLAIVPALLTTQTAARAYIPVGIAFHWRRTLIFKLHYWMILLTAIMGAVGGTILILYWNDGGRVIHTTGTGITFGEEVWARMESGKTPHEWTFTAEAGALVKLYLQTMDARSDIEVYLRDDRGNELYRSDYFDDLVLPESEEIYLTAGGDYTLGVTPTRRPRGTYHFRVSELGRYPLKSIACGETVSNQLSVGDTFARSDSADWSDHWWQVVPPGGSVQITIQDDTGTADPRVLLVETHEFARLFVDPAYWAWNIHEWLCEFADTLQQNPDDFGFADQDTPFTGYLISDGSYHLYVTYCNREVETATYQLTMQCPPADESGE